MPKHETAHPYETAGKPGLPLRHHRRPLTAIQQPTCCQKLIVSHIDRAALSRAVMQLLEDATAPDH